MVGNEEASGSWGEFESSDNNPRRFWRSASWSSSRTMPHDPDNEGRNVIDLNVNLGSTGAQCQKAPHPLTPRSQQNCKGRAALPPLQPLTIARRSVEEWPRAGSDDIGEWGPLTPGGRDVNKGGQRLKLDMSVIQKNSEKNAGLVKRDKIACFDKQCSKVAEHIYLGGEAVARDRTILKEYGITHVLNCVGFVCPEYFKTDFVYKTLWLQDKASEDITSILYDVFDYFEDVREQKGRVFVHCCQGVSRSTSLVIAYRMWRDGQNFDDAFQYVKEARGIADPNMGFACQLLQCQKRVHAFPLSPSSLLRVYRMAPHSPYDPLHLVPKMLNNPSPSGLDSRGAFIIQGPSAIYVWIGKNCEVIMERDARAAVCQIVRYEKVDAPVHVIQEGDEPSSFWDTFSHFLLDRSTNRGEHMESLANIQAGERKVDLYDIDFEIFHKATMGGFVPPLASSEVEHETHLPVRENSWSALRRKFASGQMKEFLLVSKLAVNKLHPNSCLNDDREDVGTKPEHSSDSPCAFFQTIISSASSPSWPSSSSSATSSSSSRPYLSPESISSDSSSSSNHISDSPLDSPSAFSTASSSFFKLSHLSSKISENRSSHPGYIEVNFALQHGVSTCSSSKRSQLSIAERRGSLSRFLKLPVKDDSKKTRDITRNVLGNQPDDNIIFELGNQLNVSRIGDEGFKELTFRNDGVRSCHKESTLDSGSNELGVKQVLSRQDESNILAGVKAGGVHYSYPMQRLVYRFPSLEKISVLATCLLDSKSAFLFIAPEKSSGSGEARSMYIWIGSSFTFNQHQYMRNKVTGVEVGNVGLVDWNQVGSDVLMHMGLPRYTSIKIVREGEELEDLKEALRML